MRNPRRFDQFRDQHGRGLRRATCIALRDGELWMAETDRGRWAISFFPHRLDHPDAPVTSLTATSADIGCRDDDTAAAEAWARRRFAERDERHFIEVHLEQEASPDELERVRELFDSAGLLTIVTPAIHRRSADVLPWIVVIKITLTALASGFAAKAGADAWDEVRRFVARLYASRHGPAGSKGSIMIDEPHRSIILRQDLPKAAYSQLTDLPETGYFLWDENEQCWTSAYDASKHP